MMWTFAPASLLATLVAVSSVTAHFTMEYPATRGFSDDDEPKFCGGFPTNSTGRHPFPLSGKAPVSITSHHSSAQIAIILSLKADPVGFADFNSSNQVSYLKTFSTIQGQGGFCFYVDVASLSSQATNISNGSLATLQVEYNGGDGLLFQCSDLILVQNFTVPSNVTCSNSTGTSAQAGSNSSTSGSTAQQSAKSGASSSLAGQTFMLTYIVLVAAMLFAIA